MILKKIIDAKKFKKEIIKAKLISTEGSVPRDAGTFMLITSKYLFGSIGGGQLEYSVIQKAKKFLNEKEIINNEIINIPLGPSIGQCCGGYVQVKITKHDNGIQSLKNEKFIILGNDSFKGRFYDAKKIGLLRAIELLLGIASFFVRGGRKHIFCNATNGA